MTVERNIVVGLDDVRAISFQCNQCEARSVFPRAEDLAVPPTRCPNGHAWNWNVEADHREIGAPAAGFTISLNRLRLKGSSEKNGFRILLEFKDPTL